MNPIELSKKIIALEALLERAKSDGLILGYNLKERTDVVLDASEGYESHHARRSFRLTCRVPKGVGLEITFEDSVTAWAVVSLGVRALLEEPADQA